MARDSVDLVVLDTLANDLENIEHILWLANHDAVGWRDLNGGRDYGRDQIVPALLRLVRDDLVEACRYSESAEGLVPMGSGVLLSGELDDYWFRMTPRGRLVHSSWEPNAEPRS